LIVGGAGWRSRNIASQAVRVPIGSDAAATNPTCSGIRATTRWSTATRSAQHPSRVTSPVPITRSPTAKPPTPGPTWLTTPANCQPEDDPPSRLGAPRLADGRLAGVDAHGADLDEQVGVAELRLVGLDELQREGGHGMGALVRERLHPARRLMGGEWDMFATNARAGARRAYLDPPARRGANSCRRRR
jgi:hypothetical protein